MHAVRARLRAATPTSRRLEITTKAWSLRAAGLNQTQASKHRRMGNVAATASGGGGGGGDPAYPHGLTCISPGMRGRGACLRCWGLVVLVVAAAAGRRRRRSAGVNACMRAQQRRVRAQTDPQKSTPTTRLTNECPPHTPPPKQKHKQATSLASIKARLGARFETAPLEEGSSAYVKPFSIAYELDGEGRGGERRRVCVWARRKEGWAG